MADHIGGRKGGGRGNGGRGDRYVDHGGAGSRGRENDQGGRGRNGKGSEQRVGFVSSKISEDRKEHSHEPYFVRFCKEDNPKKISSANDAIKFLDSIIDHPEKDDTLHNLTPGGK